MSGYAAFTALLSLFPFLLFLTALAGFLGDEDVASRVLTIALDLAPHEVVDVLRPVIYEVLTQRHANLLTAGIVFALWSASSGVEALRTILNRSYGAAETRRIWMLRAQSVVIVILGSVFALSIAGMVIFGPFLADVFRWLLAGQLLDYPLSALWRYGIAGSIVTAGLIVLHLTLPDCDLGIRDVAVGAVITTVLWLIGAGAFSVYVENFAQFSVTYGSLGGIILTLLFFYVTAIIFAYGAEVNAQLQHASDEPPPDKLTTRSHGLLHGTAPGEFSHEPFELPRQAAADPTMEVEPPCRAGHADPSAVSPARDTGGHADRPGGR